jgi:hypothetical protein
MPEGETDCGPGSARGTPANGIHHHEHGPAGRSKQLVDIFRSPCFFHAVLSEITPHGSNELFRVGHACDSTPRGPDQCALSGSVPRLTRTIHPIAILHASA